MHEKIIHENILATLENITEIVRSITESSTPYRQLDLDYLLEQIRHLYDEVIHLNRVNQQLLEKNISQLQFSSAHLPQEKETSPASSKIEEPLSVESKFTEKTPSAELQPNADETNTKSKNTSEPNATHSPQAEQNNVTVSRTESQILADKYLGKYKALYEQFSEKNKQTTNKFEKPINNLKTEIALNDKFRFIQTIFQGNPQAYDQFILKLESSKNLEEATAFAEILFQEKGMMDEEIKKLLFNYLQRRFKS